VVLLLHRPMYVAYPHKSNREVADHLRAQMEPLLLQHKVDLTVAGEEQQPVVRAGAAVQAAVPFPGTR
jgi:hypothetical protein